MLRTWGGLGDQICAEPTIKFALDTFKDCEVSLAAERPELFQHLFPRLKRVYNLSDVQPLWEKYFCFNTIQPVNNLVWEFMSHMLVNCVDYPSLCAFRCQLPISYKPVTLAPTADDFAMVHAQTDGVDLGRVVAVHPGKHWQSKTFPAAFWNAVLAGIRDGGGVPVIIGADTEDNRSTVEVDTEGCVDLRNRLSIMESVALLHTVEVLLTNDSSPLHMAAAGEAWIGYVATCKHPDMIAHWRRDADGLPAWSHRMQNFGRGGIWDIINNCPNKDPTSSVQAETVPPEVLESWLPDPREFAAWAVSKVKRRG